MVVIRLVLVLMLVIVTVAGSGGGDCIEEGGGGDGGGGVGVGSEIVVDFVSGKKNPGTTRSDRLSSEVAARTCI